MLRVRRELRWIFSSHYYGTTGPDGRIVRGTKAEVRVNPEGDLFYRLLTHCFFLLQSCLIDRNCVVQIGNFTESLLRSQDYDLLLRLACRFEFSGIEEPTFILRRHGGMRGPLVERHAVTERLRIWSKYDRYIGSWIRGGVELGNFTRNPWSASAASPVDARLALIKRAVVMASKGLIPEMIEDCVNASTMRAESLSNDERISCERLLRCYQFWLVYRSNAPAFWQGVRALSKTRVGREMLMRFFIGLLQQAKWHDTRWTERRHHLSMSLRILAECGVRGWRYGG